MNAPVRSPTRSPRRTICFSDSRRPGLEVATAPDDPLAAQVAAAIDSGADVIVAAGGDGTITAVASALVGTDRRSPDPFAVGNRNCSPAITGIPLDVTPPSRRSLRCSHEESIAGEVNGAVFLHKIVFGFVPGLAAAREAAARPWISQHAGVPGPLFRRVQRARRTTVEIEIGQGSRRTMRCVCPSQCRITITMKAIRTVLPSSCLDGGSLLASTR